MMFLQVRTSFMFHHSIICVLCDYKKLSVLKRKGTAWVPLGSEPVKTHWDAQISDRCMHTCCPALSERCKDWLWDSVCGEYNDIGWVIWVIWVNSIVSVSWCANLAKCTRNFFVSGDDLSVTFSHHVQIWSFKSGRNMWPCRETSLALVLTSYLYYSLVHLMSDLSYYCLCRFLSRRRSLNEEPAQAEKVGQAKELERLSAVWSQRLQGTKLNVFLCFCWNVSYDNLPEVCQKLSPSSSCPGKCERKTESIGEPQMLSCYIENHLVRQIRSLMAPWLNLAQLVKYSRSSCLIKVCADSHSRHLKCMSSIYSK